MRTVAQRHHLVQMKVVPLLSTRAVHQVSSVNWLSRIGIPEIVAPASWHTKQVERPGQASEIVQAGWDSLLEMAVGDLQGHLFRHHRDIHQKWNDYVRESNSLLAADIIPALNARLSASGLAGPSATTVRYQLRAALIELSLLDLGVPAFFSRLLEFYETGHLPCGWAGQYPSSRIGDDGQVAQFVRNGTLYYW